jgi:hypothetical protein
VFRALDPTPAPSVLAVKHGKASGHAHAPGQANKAAKQNREDRGDQGTVAAAATPTSITFLGLTPAARGDKNARPEHGRPAHAGSGHGKGAKQSPVAVTDPVLPAPVTPAVAPDDPSGPGNGHGNAYGHDKA